MKFRLDLLVTLAALVALAAIAFWTYSTWPKMPLDMSANDPRVAAALESARELHLLRAALAATVPVALLVLALLLRKRR